LRGRGRSLATYSYQVNSSHFRGFFTGSDPVKNALFTGFEIFYPAHEKHCESSEVFYRFFHGLKTHRVFHRVLHIGSDPVKNALFTGRVSTVSHSVKNM